MGCHVILVATKSVYISSDTRRIHSFIVDCQDISAGSQQGGDMHGVGGLSMDACLK